MKKPLPIGVEYFNKIRSNDYYYVDKTLFIKELIDKKGEVNLFTRPRRFGKTLTLDMLRCFFEEGRVDAVTVAPYMGADSVKPFLGYADKWVILLALTSNNGSHDFQLTTDTKGERLFEKVLRKSQEWADADQLMYVVGATQGQAFEDIRKIVPNHFLLVPGVGAQGGSLEEVCKYGMNSQCGLIVNSSRGIIYAGKGEDFAAVARQAARDLQQQMSKQLQIMPNLAK